MVAPASRPATGTANTPSQSTWNATQSPDATAFRTVYDGLTTDFLPFSDSRFISARLDFTTFGPVGSGTAPPLHRERRTTTALPRSLDSRWPAGTSGRAPRWYLSSCHWFPRRLTSQKDWAANRLLFKDNSTSHNVVFFPQHQRDRFAIRNVLPPEDAPSQRVIVVGVEHRHGLRQDDRSVVEVGNHEVHGTARHLHAVVERLLLRVKSRKRRQQRRVDVQDAIGKLLYEPRRQQSHIASKADEIDFVVFQCGDDQTVVLLARYAFRRDDQRLQPAPPRRLDAGSVRLVGDDDSDDGVELARRNVVGDGLKVRPAPGKQDAKVLHADDEMIL